MKSISLILYQVMLLPQVHFESIQRGRHSQPHSVLGMHFENYEGHPGLRVGVFLKGVKGCSVVECDKKGGPGGEVFAMERISGEGYFEVFIAGHQEFFNYFLRITYENGDIEERYDPYCFWPTLSDFDLYLFNEGKHQRIYEKLGGHVCEVEGIGGVRFAVWAPNACRVSVVSDFNYWDGRYHCMRSMGVSGIWELFIPGVAAGCKYKYEIIDGEGNLHIKSDPYAVHYEKAPNCASIAYDISNYKWGDELWIEKRGKIDSQKEAISIYEVHLGSWRRNVEEGGRVLRYREVAEKLSEYVKEMGFTHVEFLPLSEHPFGGSWGYQVTGFYAPAGEYGSPEDFMYLVDTMHQKGIGVIIDWVPGHFPRDNFAMGNFDGTGLYEHIDPRQGVHPDWGTFIFNYGRKEVVNFLIGSALAWVERFHIDGLRVDAVASMLYLDYSRKDGEWVANQYGGKENIEAIEFLRNLNDAVHKNFPGVLTIAEESTAFAGMTRKVEEGGIGFDFKWNMGWMHDVLLYFGMDPIYRKYYHNQLTFAMLYQYTENFISVFSHDEVVHGKGSMIMKMPGNNMAEKAQTLRALYGFMWMWPGKKTLFMGSEFGQSSEWKHDRSLDWHLLQYQDHKGIQNFVRDMNFFYFNNKGLGMRDCCNEGFEWVDADCADESVISFLRLGGRVEETFLVVGNFTPVVRENYRIGVPYEGEWREVINSNASQYGGSGLGNEGGIRTEGIVWNYREYSLNIVLPGISIIVFQFIRTNLK
ncbi:MAG: 1,4-alpha-glucan branching enzyme [Verrucomicrobia bacterium]|nr:MAG: 1,4-alpha-glucan branching enzyme [Verrucomicrobiota bacterium]